MDHQDNEEPSTSQEIFKQELGTNEEKGNSNEPCTSSTVSIKVENQLSDHSDEESEPEEGDEEAKVILDNLTEDYENELEENLTAEPKKTKKRKFVRNRSKIPIHLKGLMGQANILLAQNAYEMAEKMCYEVIRQVPFAHEPYLTLSHIYEGKQPEKSLQYLTIAAHLKPRESCYWCELAQMHIDRGNYKQAITCYTKAIAAEPTNISLQQKRIQLLEMINDTKFILRCKLKLLHILTENESDLIISLAQEITEKYFLEKDYMKAIEALNIPFTKCPLNITLEVVNKMLELLIITKNYTPCIDIFVQHCNIDIEIMLDDENKVNILSYNIPDNIPIDLRIKFIICLIKFEAFTLVNELLNQLLCEENIECIGDLYLDVAEALMVSKRPLDALKLLVPLVKSKNFSLAAVWLKHAECLEASNMDEQAIDSYQTVIKMAPQHTAVRNQLSNLFLKHGRKEEALQVLDQDLSNNEIDISLLVKKIKLLKELNNYKEYYKSIMLMLSTHCIKLKHYNELKTAITTHRFLEKVKKLTTLRKIREEEMNDDLPIALKELTVEEEYIIFREAVETAYKKRHTAEMQLMVYTALMSTRFKNQFNDLAILALFATIINRDQYHCFYVIRELLFVNLKNNLLWNLFNVFTQSTEEMRHYKTLLRINKTFKGNHIKILLANNALLSGCNNFGMAYLIDLLKENPSPFFNLLSGIMYLQIAFRKSTLHKTNLLQIVYGFMQKYARNRSKDALQEVYYNMGRLYQHVGLLHLAVVYYEKVLGFESEITNKYHEILDLKREAAFNLHLIYKKSENYIAARSILMKYIVV